MIIGVPKEIKDNEYRVALTPAGARQLVEHGHQVRVQTNAGAGIHIDDAAYEAAGATIVGSAAEAWQANMVMKVKEPQASEYGFMRNDLVLFTYLHLAADEPLTRAMLDSGGTGIAYDTVEDRNGRLPLLAPMSQVAGRMSIQAGVHYLQKPSGGRGMLVGGVPGVPPASIVIIGGGVVGTNAAQMALGLGASVTILDTNIDRLAELDLLLHGRNYTLASNAYNISNAIQNADLVIGGVLIKGAKAPKIVTREMIDSMKPGSVVVDVAVDQGGCFETTHATTHSDPVYWVGDVIHYAVANMPGAVPYTSTYALSNATLPYALRLADMGAEAAIARDSGLVPGVNSYAGKLTYQAVAEAFNLDYTPLSDVIAR